MANNGNIKTDGGVDGHIPDKVDRVLRDAIEASLEDAVDRMAVDADADIEVARYDTGARLRTNMQVGSASERVNITEELHGRTLADIVVRLDTYREVLADHTEWAAETAREANDDA